jgi:hypothetical protein
MTWKDKLEIGLKDDAPFRRDNVPEFQQEPGTETPHEPDRSPEQPGARDDARAAARAAKRKSRRLDQEKRDAGTPPAKPSR